MAGVGFLVAAALLATAVLSVVLMHGYLLSQVDAELNGPADRLFNSPSGGPPPVALLKSGTLPTPFVFALLDPQGRLLTKVGGSEEQADGGPDLTGLTTARARALGTDPTTVASVDGPDGYRIRTTVRPDGRVAVLSLSLHAMQSALHRLTVVAFLTALIVLAAVVALSAIVVRLGMQPLIQMEHTVEAISRGDLSRRVPEGPARTEAGRLGAAFNGMLTKIEAAFRQKEQSEQTLRQFVADAGHELRTPLSTIRGYAELTRTGALPDQPARDQAMERIEAETARLGVLVDELLLLARLDQHRPLNPTGVDLVALARDAVADAQIRDLSRAVSYHGPETATIVQVDADRIRQVLTNLLSNALIHTTPGTPVRVRLVSADGMVRLSVEDEGPGLSPDQVARVFERFYRVDASRGRASGGSGLGLAIVQSVVEASGGSVTCESSLAAGTTFTVALPLSAG
jgi:two-component system OmpR family sensor kinase